MELYSLEASGYNDGEYEDAWHWHDFYGIFSTIEKAKEYAEKLINRKRLYYCETFEVNEDWHETEKGIWKKEIFYGEGYTDEWDATYRISKITVDPEYKED